MLQSTCEFRNQGLAKFFGFCLTHDCILLCCDIDKKKQKKKKQIYLINWVIWLCNMVMQHGYATHSYSAHRCLLTKYT